MKTTRAIGNARVKLSQRLQTPGLSAAQKAVLCGMLNALTWVLDGPYASTMDRILADEPFDIGKSDKRDDARAALAACQTKETGK